MKNLFIFSGRKLDLMGLTLAENISKVDGELVKVFLMEDAVNYARKSLPEAYNSFESRANRILDNGNEVNVCDTCVSNRNISKDDIIEGINIGSLTSLTEWSIWADKVFNF